MEHFVNLPQEILSFVISFLDIEDISSLPQLNKFWNETILNINDKICKLLNENPLKIYRFIELKKQNFKYSNNFRTAQSFIPKNEDENQWRAIPIRFSPKLFNINKHLRISFKIEKINDFGQMVGIVNKMLLPSIMECNWGEFPGTGYIGVSSNEASSAFFLTRNSEAVGDIIDLTIQQINDTKSEIKYYKNGKLETPVFSPSQIEFITNDILIVYLTFGTSQSISIVNNTSNLESESQEEKK